MTQLFKGTTRNAHNKTTQTYKLCPFYMFLLKNIFPPTNAELPPWYIQYHLGLNEFSYAFYLTLTLHLV